MARPNLQDQRRVQIVDAAMQCVAQHGVSGLTLEQVAEAADLARPLIRHNVGNREQLVSAVMTRYLEKSSAHMDTLYEQLPTEAPFTKMIDYLFDTQYSDKNLMLVAEALIAESANDKNIATLMRGWLNDFIGRLEKVARNEFPNADRELITTVVTGVTSIYFTMESLSPLRELRGELNDFTHSSKKAALLLAQII